MELGVSASHPASPVLEQSQEILEGRCQPPEIRHRPTWSSRLCQAKSTASMTRSVALPSLALRFMLLLSSGQSRVFNLMRYVRRYTPHTADDATWGPRAMTDAGSCCVVTAGPAPLRLPATKVCAPHKTSLMIVRAHTLSLSYMLTRDGAGSGPEASVHESTC